MVADSGFSPVAILIHVLGIAAGIFLGFQAMDAIAPNLPDETVPPAVSSSTAPEAVAGDDPDSLFLPANLGPALDRLIEQTAASQQILRLRIEPGKLSAQTAAGDGLIDPASVSPEVPRLIADDIQSERAKVSLMDIRYFELVATDEGPRWYVQLDINVTDVSPPWTYGAPLSGEPLTVGGAPPVPISSAEPAQLLDPVPVDSGE